MVNLFSIYNLPRSSLTAHWLSQQIIKKKLNQEPLFYLLEIQTTKQCLKFTIIVMIYFHITPQQKSFEEFVRNFRGNEVDDVPCYAFPRKFPLPIL